MQSSKPSDEPEFMKYIKNMNINQISPNYIAGNSIGNYQPKVNNEIPEEYRGLSSSQLECNIKKLEMDMEAELMSIRLRYETKINQMTESMNLIK